MSICHVLIQATRMLNIHLIDFACRSCSAGLYILVTTFPHVPNVVRVY